MRTDTKQRGWKHHEWEYMGHSSDHKHQYAYCALCDKWMIDEGKPFKMKPEQYQEMLDKGEITGV